MSNKTLYHELCMTLNNSDIADEFFDIILEMEEDAFADEVNYPQEVDKKRDIYAERSKKRTQMRRKSRRDKQARLRQGG